MYMPFLWWLYDGKGQHFSVCPNKTLISLWSSVSFVCIPSDSETDVAIHLPVCGETVPRDDRTGGEGVQRPPQHLLLQQGRHGRQSEPPLSGPACFWDWSRVVSAVTTQTTGSRCCWDSWQGCVWELERKRTCTSLVTCACFINSFHMEVRRGVDLVLNHVGVWEGWRCWCSVDELEWCSGHNGSLCCGLAPEGQRGQGLFRKCGSATDHHGSTDQVSPPEPCLNHYVVVVD